MRDRNYWRHGCYLYATCGLVKTVFERRVPRLTILMLLSMLFPWLLQRTLLHLLHLPLSIAAAILQPAMIPGGHLGKIGVHQPDSNPVPRICLSEPKGLRGVRWHFAAAYCSE